MQNDPPKYGYQKMNGFNLNPGLFRPDWFFTICYLSIVKCNPFSYSNSRRRHESEEGDSHRRHKHKKSKRSKEGKEAGSEPVPEQESAEAAPAE